MLLLTTTGFTTTIHGSHHHHHYLQHAPQTSALTVNMWRGSTASPGVKGLSAALGLRDSARPTSAPASAPRGDILLHHRGAGLG